LQKVFQVPAKVGRLNINMNIVLVPITGVTMLVVALDGLSISQLHLPDKAVRLPELILDSVLHESVSMRAKVTAMANELHQKCGAQAWPEGMTVYSAVALTVGACLVVGAPRLVQPDPVFSVLEM
jgi:hypothetical protein